MTTAAADNPTIARGGPSPSEAAPTRVACTHCELPAPPNVVAGHDRLTPWFCCAGCKTAHSIITSCGLEGYYGLLRADGIAAAPVPPVAGASAGATDSAGVAGLGTHSELDHPALLAIIGTTHADGSISADLALHAVHCASCVWLLERLDRIVPGVLSARVNLSGQSFTVRWDPAVTRLSQISIVCASLGYPVSPARDGAMRDARKAEDRRWLVRIGVAGALSANIMLLAFVLYSGLFVGIEAKYETLFRRFSTVLGLISLLGPGAVFLRSAWASLRARSLNLDVPICTALVVGAVMGLVNTILNRGDIYFDSLSMLVFLLLTGRFIQHCAQRRAADRVRLLMTLTPHSARRVGVDGAIADVPLEALTTGDIVEVRPGDSIPVDGIVTLGESSVDSAILTGESRPRRTSIGDVVYAGAVNLAAVLRIRTTQTGRHTRTAKIMRLVEEGSSRRPAILRFTDNVAAWFVVGTTLAAIAAYAAWASIDAAVALDHATSMLIVTCPCALGLAAPLVMGIATARAASNGIMVKGADVLESLSRPARGIAPTTIVLDKTGTVTLGQMRVERAWCDDHALQLAAALEASSTHPIAAAVVAHAHDHRAAGDRSDAGERTQTIEQHQHVLGAGIRGIVHGQSVAVGSPTWIASLGTPLDTRTQSQLEDLAAAALTPVVIAVDARVAGVIGIGDPIRDEAPQAVRDLQRLGYRIELLSGDDAAVVRSVGKRLGIAEESCIGSASPEQKADRIARLNERGRVVMVGDGVNDAAALARATVGVAVHRGAEACLSAADVCLTRPGIASLVSLVRGATASMRAVRWTLYASLAYNIIAGSLTFVGLIHPMTAAILMPVSSLTMLAIALRARTFDTTTPDRGVAP